MQSPPRPLHLTVCGVPFSCPNERRRASGARGGGLNERRRASRARGGGLREQAGARSFFVDCTPPESDSNSRHLAAEIRDSNFGDAGRESPFSMRPWLAADVGLAKVGYLRMDQRRPHRPHGGKKADSARALSQPFRAEIYRTPGFEL